MGVERPALNAVPYLNPNAGDERIINLTSLWDGTSWHAWLPHEGGLIKIQGGEVVEGGYFAKAMQRDGDVFLPFLDFMWKHGSWRELTHRLSSIEKTMFSIAASLAKIEHFNECFSTRSEDERVASSSFISTEVEYLFGRCRSLFDDLQVILRKLWDRVILLDENERRRKGQLPESFRSAVQRIQKRKAGEPTPYGLPEPIVQAYEKVAKFFFSMREIRDRIMHGGGSGDTVFMVDGGNAVLRTSRLASMASNLGPEHKVNENLVSLPPVLAHLVFSTLSALHEFAVAFSSVLKWPDSLMPDHRYFLRCPHMSALVKAYEVLQGPASPPPPSGTVGHSSSEPTERERSQSSAPNIDAQTEE